jgi:hypothetical protein
MLKHRKVSTVDDGAVASEIQPSNWNDQHVLSGGTHGALVYRDTTDVDGGHAFLAAGGAGKILRAAGAVTVPAWSTLTIPDTATAGDVLHASATNTVTGLAIGAAGKILRSTGSLPAWSTLTVPNTATAGDLLHASASNTITGLAIGAAGKLLRSSGTLPAWSTLTVPDSATAGDLLHASATNTVTGLGIGGSGTILRSTGTLPAWSTTTWPNAATTGDLLVATGSNAIGVVAAVATGRVLVSAGTSTVPAWSTSPSLTALTLSGNLQVADVLATGSNGVRVDNAAFFFWNTFSAIKSPADGIICLTNNAVTAFTRLQFGGTSASFPAIARSTTALEIKLADDSAYAQLNALVFNVTSGGSTTISTGIGSVKMATANAATNAAWIPMKYAGTTYYVPGWTAFNP